EHFSLLTTGGCGKTEELRAAGADHSGYSLKVGDELYFAPCGEQAGDGVALAVTDLHQETAAGVEGMPCVGDEAAVDVQSGGAGEERVGRLIVTDLFFQNFVFGNVGRVRDDDVEGFAWDRCQQIGLQEPDAAGHAVTFGILAGDFERGRREFQCSNLGQRERMGDGDGDGSAAGAYVGYL